MANRKQKANLDEESSYRAIPSTFFLGMRSGGGVGWGNVGGSGKTGGRREL